MLALRLALARLLTNPIRHLATIAGVAAVALLASVAWHLSVAGHQLDASTPGEPLVTMQAGRICPSTSQMDRQLVTTVGSVPGVAHATAHTVVVSDCSVSTTATTFRGVDSGAWLAARGDQIHVVDGSLDTWQRTPDSVLVGEQIARQRGLTVGQTFEASGVTATIAAVVSGPRMMDRGSVWAHHAHLVTTFPALAGQATLFEATLAPGTDSAAVGAAIDAALGGISESAPLSATAARVAGSLAAAMRAGGAVNGTALLAAAALMLASAVIAVRRSSRDLVVLRAIGHPRRRLVATLAIESAVTGLIGGAIGVAAAAVLLHHAAPTISTEGIIAVIDVSMVRSAVLAMGVMLLAFVCGAVPAWWALRRRPTAALGGG